MSKKEIKYLNELEIKLLEKTVTELKRKYDNWNTEIHNSLDYIGMFRFKLKKYLYTKISKYENIHNIIKVNMYEDCLRLHHENIIRTYSIRVKLLKSKLEFITCLIIQKLLTIFKNKTKTLQQSFKINGHY